MTAILDVIIVAYAHIHLPAVTVRGENTTIRNRFRLHFVCFFKLDLFSVLDSTKSTIANLNNRLYSIDC